VTPDLSSMRLETKMRNEASYRLFLIHAQIAENTLTNC
jgi:hypothetical protein